MTTDPAVAVAFNDTPFIRNHFFEQEFYDVSQVEVLRGPQGTLYGRNATAGVVNVISAKPTDHFEAMLSADWGNYTNRRYEGMVNIPIVDDKLDLRVAGEWTKRDGYTIEHAHRQADRRARSVVEPHDVALGARRKRSTPISSGNISRKTTTASAAASSFATPIRGRSSLHYDNGHGQVRRCAASRIWQQRPHLQRQQGQFQPGLPAGHRSTTRAPAWRLRRLRRRQWLFAAFRSGARLLRAVQRRQSLCQREPVHQSARYRLAGPTIYRAKNDTLEFNAEWQVTPVADLQFAKPATTAICSIRRKISTASKPRLASFKSTLRLFTRRTMAIPAILAGGAAACIRRTIRSTSLRAMAGNIRMSAIRSLAAPTVSSCRIFRSEHSWQVSQEFRFTSNFKGPFNFSVGGNYLHYETYEDFIVLSNSFTAIASEQRYFYQQSSLPVLSAGCSTGTLPALGPFLWITNMPGYLPGQRPAYIDPNPLSQINGQGHNYFDSKNPYVVNSYAAVRRGLLQHHTGSEIHRRLALDL